MSAISHGRSHARTAGDEPLLPYVQVAVWWLQRLFDEHAVMTIQAACSRELEEERRNGVVAITRAERTRILTRAERYHGYPKPPAQFRAEMGIGTETGR